MNSDDTPGMDLVPYNEVVGFLRWSARILGILMAGFFLLMFIGESLESRSFKGIPDRMTVVKLIPAFAYVIGMFLALKRERAGAKLGGASLVIVAITIPVFVPHRAGTLGAIWAGIIGLAFALPVILYGLCWRLEERDHKRLSHTSVWPGA